MKRPRFLLVLTCILAVAPGLLAQAPPPPNHKHYDTPAGYDQAEPGKPIAPRLQNLGVHTFPVTTKNRQAQLFINQGLNLTYAFNHAEAARAFAEAARLDPRNAMAYWGHALVLGPNINAPMNPDDEPKALDLVRKAVALKGNASPRERAYIDALTVRYTGKAEDRKTADRAYADAMRKLVERYPDDLDARTLFAESLMDVRPWNYWTRDGLPYPETRDVESSLTQVLAKHKDHPGALHLWLHLWEATDTPERAEAQADRLLPLMPGAGHIVHMPAHIYQRVGRFEDVIKVNIQAAKADEDYITQCRAQGIYPLAYYPHNLHFIWMGASAAGQSKLALDSATRLAKAIPHAALTEVPILQGFVVVPYWAMVRFEKWDDILADKGPEHATPFTSGVWRYARAMALVGKDRLDEAGQELEQLRAIVADPAINGQVTFSSNSGTAILRIAPEVIAVRIAAKRKAWDTAILHLDRAIRYEDALVYQEPHDWHAPVRQDLGNVLLAARRADEAEVAFWEDLKRNPENGWSLFGLMQALDAQGKKEDAAMVEARFNKAWKNADIKPAATTASDAAQPAARNAVATPAGNEAGAAPAPEPAAPAREAAAPAREAAAPASEAAAPAREAAAPARNTAAPARDTAAETASEAVAAPAGDVAPGREVVLKSGVRLRYVQQGPAEGPALIMLHGYSDSSFSFSRVMPLLPSSLRVIVPDQRGHGRSARTQAGYDMNAMARDVIELMDALDVPSATVVGHSMGSFVARRAAVLAPQRVSRLVLVGAGPSATNAAILELRGAVETMKDPVSRDFVSEFQFSTISRPVPAPFMDRVIAESLILDAATWQAVIAGLVAYPPAEADLRVPTLVIGGDKDSVFTVEEQRALGGRIRGARVKILSGIGHTPHWEDPALFVKELLGFILPS